MDLDQAKGSEVFASAAAAFLNAVGASTGPLYASAFIKAGQALKKDETLSIGKSGCDDRSNDGRH
jgi:dihydroxyacetone kinase-like protein